MRPLDLHWFDENTNTTAQSSLSSTMKTFYDRELLETAEPNLVFDQFGEKRPIPPNNGKIIQFRRFGTLAKALTALTEGYTPPGNSISMTNITATVAQYGDFVKLSDMLQMTSYDPIISETAKALASQAQRTIDTIIREAVTGGSQVIYSGYDNSGTWTETEDREDLTAKCTLTVKDILRAAADLKAMNAPTIDGSYVGVVHPYVEFDLLSSDAWQDVHKYAAPENIFRGEIGKIGNVRFVSSNEAKIIAPVDIATGFNRLTCKTAISSSSTEVVVKEVIPEALCGTLDEAVDVYVAGVANTVTAIEYGAGGATLTLGTAITSLAVSAMICGAGAGADGSAVFCTMILGKGGYGVTELAGGGLEVIVKPLGYSDELNQRSSVGWKTTLVAKRLNEEYMVRVESGSAYSDKAQTN